MTKKIGVVSLFFLLTWYVGLNITYADNAEVLPKGVSRVSLDGKFYFPIDKKYDPDGKAEDIVADRKEHMGVIGLSYSTVPLFQAKKFPIPLTVTLSYRNRFAGENVLKSQYIGFGLSVFF